MDDQDILINGMDAFPKSKQIFLQNGIEFINAFASTPVCCVSRASILTGRYVHNSQVYNNSLEGGCAASSFREHNEPYSYAAYLSNVNYQTFFSGKYLNNYGLSEQMPFSHVPQGWTDWYGLIGDAVYYDYALSVKGQSTEWHGHNGDDDYLPYVMQEKAMSFLQDRIEQNEINTRPYLLSFAFPSGHVPWRPPNKYQYILENTTMTTPKVDNFNYFDVDGSNDDKGPVVRRQHPMNDEQMAMADKVYRGRHGCFMAADDVIYEIYQKVKEMGELDKTYFIYTSDHGFHIGQYGMWFGKKLLYETDLRIPFFISGPGINGNTKTSKTALTIDIAPTIVDLAIGYVPDTMDGESLRKYFNLDEAEEQKVYESNQQFLIEYYGETDFRHGLEIAAHERTIFCPSHTDDIDEIECDLWDNTFKCVRVIDGLNGMASRDHDNIGEIFCSFTCFNDAYEEIECREGSVEAKGEYYDLNIDPWQLKNNVDTLSDDRKSEFEKLIAQHMECKGDKCRALRIGSVGYSKERIVSQIMLSKKKQNVVLIIGSVIFVLFVVWTFVYLEFGWHEYKYKQMNEYSPLRFGEENAYDD